MVWVLEVNTDIMDTIEKELEIIIEYDDKLSVLDKYFSIDNGSKGVLNETRKRFYYYQMI